MWEPAISGMGNTHNCAPKLQAYPLIFSLTPKASGSTRLQSCEDKVFNSLGYLYVSLNAQIRNITLLHSSSTSNNNYPQYKAPPPDYAPIHGLSSLLS
jgi:hypothetical protein